MYAAVIGKKIWSHSNNTRANNRKLSTMRMFAILTILVLALVSSARSQCSSRAILMAACQSQSSHRITTYLADDISLSEQLTIPCESLQPGMTLRGWSHSPDGSSTSTLIDTSLSKYIVNGDTLTISNISSSDEGLYRCVYDNGVVSKLCVYVYAGAVFASCPLDFAGCTGDPIPLSVEEGKSVLFNATIVHTRGGSCGFQQEIMHIQMTKINPRFGVDDEVLVSCVIEPLTTCHNADRSRLSLVRGNDPGLGFTFMLTDAVADIDASLYKVEVIVGDPRTGSVATLSKTFRLEVEKSQVNSEAPKEEANTSHSMTLKANSTIAMMSCTIIALLVLKFASRDPMNL